MRHLAVLAVTMAFGVVSACSDDDGGNGAQTAGSGGTAGGGAGGAAGLGGAAGTAGAGGNAGSSAGAGGAPAPPPTPALPADAPTLACPMVINGALETSDATQTGRHSRIEPISACGMTKADPGTAADPSNPHLFDVYRFANPTAAPVCFTLTLTYGTPSVVDVDAGADAGSLDAGATDPGLDAGDGGIVVDPPVVNTEPPKYLTAYGTFYPTNLALEYLADVGNALTSPQTLGVTVPAGETIDVVVYAIDNAPAGVGSYTLSCATQ